MVIATEVICALLLLARVGNAGGEIGAMVGVGVAFFTIRPGLKDSSGERWRLKQGLRDALGAAQSDDEPAPA
jgi:hypothetical protein